MEAEDRIGRTPLIFAASKGHVEVVRMLLESGAMKEAVDKFGSTPLISAAEEGRHEVVRMLLENGARIEAPN